MAKNPTPHSSMLEKTGERLKNKDLGSHHALEDAQ
jgi:hypothetical protein